MSGKGIIVLVTGVIIITGMIMLNIAASSTEIVKNFGDYYIRQTTQNIAQSGVNLALTRLGEDRDWRDGFEKIHIADGFAVVRVYDTYFDSIPAIAIFSVGQTDFGSGQKRRDTSIAWVFYSIKQRPIAIRGLLTLNANSAVNGNITLDGRDHDMAGNLISTNGIPAVWTTKETFVLESDAARVGGTNGGVDYAPSNPANPASMLLGQTYPGGFPMTPDSVFGGADYTFPEGTLKAIAKSGFAGSQYVTDIKQLQYPLAGVTYVEMPTTDPQNVWSSASIEGNGILIVHNTARNAVLNNASGKFKGLIIADDIMHLHADILGGVIGFRNNLSGNVVGNGNARILYSAKALEEAAKFLETASKPSVIAWWE